MKIKGKAFLIFLATALLMAIIPTSQLTLAQEKTDLTLTLLPYRYSLEGISHAWLFKCRSTDLCNGSDYCGALSYDTGHSLYRVCSATTPVICRTSVVFVLENNGKLKD